MRIEAFPVGSFPVGMLSEVNGVIEEVSARYVWKHPKPDTQELIMSDIRGLMQEKLPMFTLERVDGDRMYFYFRDAYIWISVRTDSL